MTTNWTEGTGSERLSGALLDRLTHRVHIIEANGANDLRGLKRLASVPVLPRRPYRNYSGVYMRRDRKAISCQ